CASSRSISTRARAAAPRPTTRRPSRRKPPERQPPVFRKLLNPALAAGFFAGRAPSILTIAARESSEIGGGPGTFSPLSTYCLLRSAPARRRQERCRIGVRHGRSGEAEHDPRGDEGALSGARGGVRARPALEGEARPAGDAPHRRRPYAPG